MHTSARVYGLNQEETLHIYIVCLVLKSSDAPCSSKYNTTIRTIGSPAAYSKTEEEVAGNLWTFLQGFYALYPELLDRGLYIMGERSVHTYTIYEAHTAPMYVHAL